MTGLCRRRCLDNLLISDSLHRLSAQHKLAQIQAKSGASVALVFDKDDEDILDFVAASANLRSIIFGIETRSKFDIKRQFSSINVSFRLLMDIEMAGNIIPAIATTNAMTASLCVLQSFKVMRAELGRAKMVKSHCQAAM